MSYKPHKRQYAFITNQERSQAPSCPYMKGNYGLLFQPHSFEDGDKVLIESYILDKVVVSKDNKGTTIFNLYPLGAIRRL